MTGSRYVLETPRGKLMVDCGLYQGSRRLEERNWRPFSHPPPDIRWLLLTHAHIDHSGLVPRFVREGYAGDVIATAATCDLATIMLRDSAHIQEEDAAYLQRKWRQAGRRGPEPPPPLYTLEDAEAAIERLRPVRYRELCELDDGLRVRFSDAGHILGSAFVEVWVEDSGQSVKVAFSGDLGSERNLLLRDPAVLDDADFLLIESTYGDRLHESAEDRSRCFREVVQSSIQRGGALIIPAFSVGRTQEIMYQLNNLVESHVTTAVPTFIDSPLAMRATSIFRKHPECYNTQTKALLSSGDDPFDFPKLSFTRSVQASKEINATAAPYIVISASGMCEAGRIRHHLRHHIENPQDTILFVGFQAAHTLGRRIVEGVSPIRIFSREHLVRARIESISGFSAHADRQGLLGWYGQIQEKPWLTFVTHGEPTASGALRDALAEQFGKFAYVPELGEAVELVREDSWLRGAAEAQRGQPCPAADDVDEAREEASEG